MRIHNIAALCAVSLICLPVLAAPKTAPKTDKITEITLENQPGFVAPPFAVYKVVLRADGKAWSLTGPSDNMQRKTATLDARTFSKLTQLLTERKFFAMRERYAPEPTPTDGPGVYVRASRNGTQKTVEDYMHSAPLDLWTIEMAIRGVASGLDWKPVATTLPAGVKGKKKVSPKPQSDVEIL